jgi:hypothetical protein
MPDINGLESIAVAFSPDRSDKLTLLSEVIEGGRDFHSLRWERNNNDGWMRVADISRDQFQNGCDRRRWISDLHSFESDKAHATIQVGEENEEKLIDGMLSTQVIYSWRIWDLVGNVEVRLIKLCDGPFDWLELS